MLRDHFAGVTTPAVGTSHLLLIMVYLFSVPSCAGLPDAETEMPAPDQEQVVFEGANGPIPEAVSDVIIERIEGNGPETDVLQKHLAYEEAINNDSPLVLGNRLTLLQNGPATYDAMFTALRAAQDHINLETYIFDDGEVGQQFADILLERQAAGVQVNIIYDGFGALATPAAFFDRLREAGVRVLEFNPLTGNKAGWSPNNRDHRKQLIVDGRIVFTGGLNISDTYSSSPSKVRKGKKISDTGWRDTHIQIEGPVVAEFQKLFLDTWNRQKGEPLAARNYFPELMAVGTEIVRAVGSTPEDQDSLIYLTLLSVISHAEIKIHITMAYFGPDPQLMKALTDAAKRGVEVTMVLPGYSDSWAVFHLGRSNYTELLRAGVKIYERRDALMHAKTICIDDVWSTIGSTNLDSRSFLHNDEINAVILGREFAAQMEAMFAADIKESVPVLFEQWKRRSLLLRLKEHLAMLGAYWL